MDSWNRKKSTKICARGHRRGREVVCAAQAARLAGTSRSQHAPAQPLPSLAPWGRAHQAKGVEQEELELEHGSKGDEQQGEDHRRKHLHRHPGQPEGCVGAAEGAGVRGGEVASWVL